MLRRPNCALSAVCRTRGFVHTAFPINKKGPHGGPFLFMAEKEGFEPSNGCPLHTFQACAFDHSATSPIGRGSYHRDPKPQRVSLEFHAQSDT